MFVICIRMIFYRKNHVIGKKRIILLNFLPNFPRFQKA